MLVRRMAKVTQTNDELHRHLRDNLGFLTASSASFDEGFLGEAKRLATAIRVLLHDTQNSKSLLGMLNLKHNISYVNTAIPYSPNNLRAHHGLVGYHFGPAGPSYWAPLSDGPSSRYNRPDCDFDAWWNEAVIVDYNGGSFTRRKLVLSLANKDGGAHVDPQLDAKYAALTRGDSLGEQPLSEVELHSVRQIAYELMQSLRNHGVVAIVIYSSRRQKLPG